MDKSCQIVQDLLPLFVDGACSEASAETVRAHLEECESCRECHRKMTAHTGESALTEERDSVLRRHEQKEQRHIAQYIFLALTIIYFPVILLAALFTDSNASFISLPYFFTLMVVFLYTFPFFLASMELGMAFCRLIDKQERHRGENIFNAIGTILSLWTFIPLVDLDRWFFCYIALAAAIAVNRIVATVVYKRMPPILRMLKQKTFWICLVIMVALIAACSFVFIMLSPTAVKEETLEHYISAGVRDSGSELEGVRFDIGIEEQHRWEVVGDSPTLTVKWVNDRTRDLEYTSACYVYKQTDGGWGLCATDYMDFPEDTYTVPAGGTRVHQYSIKGYDIKESGLYRFVTFVEGKAVWFNFRITISTNDLRSDEIFTYTFIITEIHSDHLLAAAIGADGSALPAPTYSLPNLFSSAIELRVGEKIKVVSNGMVTEASPFQFDRIFKMSYTDPESGQTAFAMFD